MTILVETGRRVGSWLVRAKAFVIGLVCLGAALQGRAQLTQPLVAVHNSELTLAFESMPSTPDTPTGFGTTNLQWWSTDWHYLVMPQSVEEALRSDGTPFTAIGDSNIESGLLLTNGQPKYPVLICFASEAIDDSEIAQFTNYVAAGGFLISSGASFTRNTNGTTRGDFAFANAMGIHMVNASLANYYGDYSLTNLSNNRLTSHIPFGGVQWRLCQKSEEENWGDYGNSYSFMTYHDAWQITASDATVLANGDTYPYYTIKPYGKGYFIYAASFNPLFCTGGFGPGTTVYLIFRHAIEWAFQNANMPVPRISPWPYQYDAAFMMRHDLENFPDHITNILASAQVEASYGVKGDYYFCTGVLKQDMPLGLVGSYDTNAVVQSIRQAITNYGATVSTHNGGLPNDLTGPLGETNYDYWHWGPDEAYATNSVPGYASPLAYATASISNSFVDCESWFAGLDSPSFRIWCSPNFNCTRDASYQFEEQLGVKVTGEQKIGGFPHFTFSTKNPTQWFHFLQEPVSEWFVNGNLAQSLEPWHEPWAETTNTLHAGIDFYYNNGLLINFYSHTMSTGLGAAGGLTPECLSYASNTNLHPRVWPINGIGLYNWWTQRSNAQISVSYRTNGMQSLATISISGSVNPNTAVEYLMPGTNAYCSLQVFANGALASNNSYRMAGQTVRVLVGTTVTNVVIAYYPYGGVTSFAENFDEVTAPALPSGWATSASGGQSPWVTETTSVDTAPNAAYSIDATTNGVNELDSPVFVLPAGQSQLTFRNFYDLEVDPSFPTNAFDGGVLEIKIGAGSYTDILAAGGAFVSGGYTSTINTNYGNPLAGRQVWSGNSGGFITTTVALPSLASSQNVQLRWRCGTDSANGNSGWRIDTVSVGGYQCLCCVNVTNPPVLPAQANRTVNQFSLMTVTNTATDTNGIADPLTYALQNPPAGAQISTNGIITWTPGGGQAPSTNLFTTIVTDLYSNSATNSFTVVVNDVNTPPELPAQSNRSIVGLTTLVVTNTATDTNIPPASLTYGLLAAPTNASISTNGIITWTPVAAQVPSTNVFTTVVTNFNPLALVNQHLTATNSFTVTDLFVHNPPVLPAQSNTTIVAQTTLVVTNTATENDLPPLALSYSLLTPPAGATIDTNGIITWTPAGSPINTTNVIRTVVQDNGSPKLSATNSFTVVVDADLSCQYVAVFAQNFDGVTHPALPTNWTTDASGVGSNWITVTNFRDTLPNSAFSPDVPNIALADLITPSIALPAGQNVLIFRNDYNLEYNLSKPTDGYDGGVLEIKIGTNAFTDVIIAGGSFNSGGYNATIDSAYQNPLTNRPAWSANSGGFITTSLTLPPSASGQTVQLRWRLGCDNGNVASGTAGWWVDTVSISNLVCQFKGPVLPAQTNRTIAEFATLTVTNAATNGTPPLTYALLNPPTGATISSAGVIAWTPAEGQSPSTNSITTVVTDSESIPLTATNSFVVDVTDVNDPPTLPAQPNYTIAGLASLVVTNTGTDSNIPPATLTYGFLASPTNANIDTNGIITWTPVLAQVPSTNLFTTVVTNYNTNVLTNQRLTATNSFTVTVDAIHNGPSLGVVANQTVDEFALLTVVNTAADSDVPALTLTYQLLSAPAGMAIDNGGVITWRPAEGQGPSTNLVVTRVVDSGSPPLSATNSFAVTVNDVNVPPLLPAQTNQIIMGLAALVVTNTASDPNIPAATLTYGFITAPTNAIIDTNGIITWTPVMAQVPSTNEFTTIVTNFNPYALVNQRLTATNTFLVTVSGIHNGPSLPDQPSQSINEFAELVVTNSALDNDIPPLLPLSYQLLNPPAGASIDTNGIITWMPQPAQAGTTNSFVTIVTDQGLPPLSATNSFTVTVNPPPPPPVILSISVSNGLASITWSTTAGYNYQLQFKDNIDDTNWNVVPPTTIALGLSLDHTNASASSTQRFYRVAIVPGN